VENVRVAILGGGDDELQILSEFHRTPGIEVIGIYDRDTRAVALEIAEIIGVPTFSDLTFIPRFLEADYVVVTEKREEFKEEIERLQAEKVKIINPSEAIDYLSSYSIEKGEVPEASWPKHIEDALQYITRITDKERLLKWLLEISVRSVNASSGSIMLYTEETGYLKIGYATGLSKEIVTRTKQKLGEGIAGKVASTKKAQLITEVIDIPLYRAGRERKRIKSAISAPLIHNGKLLGVINVSTDEGEKLLDERDLKVVERLSSKIAPILEQHLKIDVFEIREIEYEVRRFLESLFHKNLDFHEKFNMLCRFLDEKLASDTVTIYTATDEGDWLILGGSDNQISINGDHPRIHCDRGSLAKSYIDGREIILSEAVKDLTEFKLSKETDSITTIYLPLKHSRTLGVLVIEFSSPVALDKFLKMKDALRFQISFFVYSQLKEVRQQRKLSSLEELSQIPPTLISIGSIRERTEKAVELISRLLNASMGSLHIELEGFSGAFYYNFPDEKEILDQLRELDFELADLVLGRWEPICRSFISDEVSAHTFPPVYRSIIAYPLFKEKRSHAIFIGYNKFPRTPVDSSVFGDHEKEVLNRLGSLLMPIFTIERMEKGGGEKLTFEELLRSNQKLFLERISEEILRAERYHHSFTLTLFKIKGLETLFKQDYNQALSLVNQLSIGVRKRIRKTDFFSWLEKDIFGILSIERYKRVGMLEKRILEFINTELKEKHKNTDILLYPATGCASYPGTSETPSELLREARESFEK